jgi:hypothetical protein
VELTTAAQTLDQWRKVWMEAGAQGALQDVLVTDTGEKTTVRDLLIKRSDELGLKSSANSS